MSAADDTSQMIEDCEERESRLTDWERSFIDSIKEQYSRGRGLSLKQSEALDRIWTKATERG